jgi:F0F1-type ATP synthase membrane subunit b/b'
VDFLGNISLKLVGLLVTVGVMAAAYFFFVRPAVDTTNNAINSFSEPINKALEQSQQAQDAATQLQGQAKNGNQGAQVNLNKLQNCVAKANQNVNKLNACANRYAPH